MDLPKLKRGGLFRLANEDEIDHPIACIGQNGGPYTMGHYAQGYFAAGERLLRSLHEQRCDLDILVYPVVYLYRQGVELSIKYLADRLPSLLRGTGGFKPGHDLLNNWQDVRHLLVQSRADFPDEKSIREKTLKWVDGVLKQFVQIDPNSTTFRYPRDLKGTDRLRRRQHINYTNFGNYVRPLAKLFEGWMISIDQAISEM